MTSVDHRGPVDPVELSRARALALPTPAPGRRAPTDSPVSPAFLASDIFCKMSASFAPEFAGKASLALSTPGRPAPPPGPVAEAAASDAAGSPVDDDVGTAASLPTTPPGNPPQD